MYTEPAMKKKNIKLTVQYDGTRYRGWQRLGDTDKTIQGKIEEVLSRMTGEKIEIIGSGRTDAGAHAMVQVLNFKTACRMNTREILAYCYRYLPDDIIVKAAEPVDERFHARYNVKSKTYVYRIWNAPLHDVFERKYAWHVPEPLDLQRMQKAAALFIGRHNFQSFTSSKMKKKSMERDIYSIDFKTEGSRIDIYCTADGFLYNMVRIIVGTLIDVGCGRLEPEAIPDILKSKVRSNAGITAPSHGLFLHTVEF
jgi:tRNA pseudouridine38-40 synthase